MTNWKFLSKETHRQGPPNLEQQYLAHRKKDLIFLLFCVACVGRLPSSQVESTVNRGCRNWRGIFPRYHAWSDINQWAVVWQKNRARPDQGRHQPQCLEKLWLTESKRWTLAPHPNPRVAGGGWVADCGGTKIGFSLSSCRPAMQTRPSGIWSNWLSLFTRGLSESAIGRLHGGTRHDNPIKGGVRCGSDREVVGRSACEVALVRGIQKRSGVVCTSFCSPQTFVDSKACMHRASRKLGTAVLNAWLERSTPCSRGAGYIMPGSHGWTIFCTTLPGRMLEKSLKLLCLPAPSLVLCVRGVGFFTPQCTPQWWSPTCTTSCSSNPAAPQLPAYSWRQPALLTQRACGMFPKLPITTVVQFILDEKICVMELTTPLQ